MLQLRAAVGQKSLFRNYLLQMLYRWALPSLLVGAYFIVGRFCGDVQAIHQTQHDREIAFHGSEAGGFPWMARPILRREVSGSHSGIYCVMAGIKALGYNIDAGSVVSSRYLSSAAGSSRDDVELLVGDCGLNSMRIDRLSIEYLRWTTSPVLLQASYSRNVEGTVHWLTYLGESKGRAIVFDPPHGVIEITYTDLIAFADRGAVALSDDKFPTWPRLAGPVMAMLWLASGILLLLIAKAYVMRTHDGIGRVDRDAVAIAAISGVLCLLHVLSTWQSSPNRDGVRYARELSLPLSPVPAISAEQVMALTEHGDINLVDARLPATYFRGTIQEAINWPVDAFLAEADHAWRQIDPERATVVFCDGPECRWADEVATRIVGRGGKDVFIFREGWRRWRMLGQSRARVMTGN